MFGIGGFELFLILLFGFLIFGPDKLPEIAKTVGKAIAKFRGAQESMTEQLKDVTLLDKDSENLIKNPLDVLGGVADSAKGAKDKISSKISDEDGSDRDVSTSSDDDVKEVSRSDSFAERKARYDRERAKRKQAQAEAAKEAERKAQEEAAEKKKAAENPKLEVTVKLVEEEGE